jgi:coproporphyrinogen III oxidase
MTREEITDARLSALEASYNNLTKAFNTNANVFGSTIQMCDAMIHVLQRVVSDAATSITYESGGVRMDLSPVYRDDEGAINFKQYIGEFYGALGTTQFITALKYWCETHKVIRDGLGGFLVEEIGQPEEQAEEPIEDDQVMVFGGGEMRVQEGNSL